MGRSITEINFNKKTAGVRLLEWTPAVFLIVIWIGSSGRIWYWNQYFQMKPVVTGADMHGIHEFEKGSIDDAGYGNPMFLAIYGFHFLCNDVNKKGAT